MMQNIPFSVTPNTAAKSAQSSAEPKGTEPVTSFKQVLSEQVADEMPKNKAPGHNKLQKPQAPTQNITSLENPVGKDGQAKRVVTGEANVDLLAGIEKKQVKLLKEDEAKDGKQESADDKPVEQNALLSGMQLQQIVNAIASNGEKTPQKELVSTETPAMSVANVSIEQTKWISAISVGGMKANEPVTETSQPYNQRIVETPLSVKTETKPQEINEPATSLTSAQATTKERFQDLLLNQRESSASAKVAQEVTATPTPVAFAAAMQSQMMHAGELQAAQGSSNLIEAYPGKPGWDMAISQKVVWMVGAEEQSATLTLNPPDLGPLQVVISVNNEKADTTFISENPDVRKALEEGIPVLRDLMNQAGVQLGQTSVGTGRQQQDFHQESSSRQSHSSTFSSDQGNESPQPDRITTRVQNGLVDTFA